MRALVVILNKDNGVMLRDCLNSLVRQTAGLCRNFEVLVMDGGSNDCSRDVAAEFERSYECVKFRVQSKLGGTGFARREACEYALENGYDAVIWGDSENIYEEDYVEKMINALNDSDAAGGIPVVRGGFYAHAFAWYHAIHLIIPGLAKKHIPGNNKAERVNLFSRFMYPESRRAEDYGFSLLLLKKGVKLKQKVVDARVHVSLPERIAEIIRWQKARARGAAEAAKLVGVLPYDAIAWAAMDVVFAILAIASFITVLPLVVYAALLFMLSMYFFVSTWKYLEKPKVRYFFAPFIGLIIYSAFSLLSLFYYLKVNPDGENVLKYAENEKVK